MEELRSFRAVIVTRHGVPEIYDKNYKILERLPFDKVKIANCPADLYITHVLTSFRDRYDWVINMDDDAFLVDPRALLSVMRSMQSGGFDYCGMADGLLHTVRLAFNPCSMNPFFNVFYLPGIWSKIPGKDIPLVPYHRNLLKKVDFTGLHPEIVGKTKDTISEYAFMSNFEPFYPVFFSLLTHTSPLFLYGRSYRLENENQIGVVDGADVTTTVLYAPEGNELVYHTWYARNYNVPNPADPTVPENNRARIDKVFDVAYARFRANGIL